jgi:hypothetical protein
MKHLEKYLEANTNPTGSRVRGLWKLVLGLGACIGVYLATIRTATSDRSYHGIEYVLLFPFVYACTGAVELITGTPFQQLANTWNQLPRWKRGLLSLLFLSCGSVLVISLVWFLFRTAK